MSIEEEYKDLYSEFFNKNFKKCLKKQKKIDEDFNVLREVIIKLLPKRKNNPLLLPQNPKKIPQTCQKDYLIIKIRMQVKGMKQAAGRVIFLFDESRKNIFFVDIYLKNQRSNHDINLIKQAYIEYLKLIKN